MTLESFVVTPETRFAHAVVGAVINVPGELYNPVVLYGGPRSGKTHLLQAIASGLPDRDVRLISARDLAERVRGDPAGLAGADVLLVDDLASVATVTAIRETLTDVVASGRQVVVATRTDSEGYDDVWAWGATHDDALAVDCWRAAELDGVEPRYVAADEIRAEIRRRSLHSRPSDRKFGRT